MFSSVLPTSNPSPPVPFLLRVTPTLSRTSNTKREFAAADINDKVHPAPEARMRSANRNGKACAIDRLSTELPSLFLFFREISVLDKNYPFRDIRRSDGRLV